MENSSPNINIPKIPQININFFLNALLLTNIKSILLFL